MMQTQKQRASLPLAQVSCCATDVPTGWLLRSARSEDLKSVVALLESAELPVEGVPDQFGPGYAVVDAGGQLIAAIGIERYGANGLLRSAVVAPSQRGKGIGEALVLERIEWSMQEGMHALYLLTTTAAHYFSRFGFHPVARADVPVEVQNSREFSSLCPATATVMRLELGTGSALRSVVRFKYAGAARRAQRGETAGCGCGCTSDTQSVDPITSNLYDVAETAGLPDHAVLASLGCGNPTALAELKPGEVVLDLGSGGGIDVLLSARRVGPTGKAFGLDMTDEMLALARANQKAAGVENVEFLKGEIENIPLPENSVDVIISNCVINLAADKRRVLQEAYRVLKPGGRFAVCDVVVRGAAPAALRRSMELWVGCVAGALEEEEYRTHLAEAGFHNIDLEPTRIYRAEDAAAFLSAAGLAEPDLIAQIDGKVMSAFVRARKPQP
jgi:SAM-dependent methyltransferase